MYLTELQVCNFRGFFGLQKIIFSTPEEECPVTVIHGENGAGKTNLLNAIFWCLTGSFTPRLSNPEMLVNKTALDEDSNVECFVELRFIHDECQYKSIRTVTGRRESKLNVFHIVDGTPRLISNGDRFIKRMIPEELSRWFFFDAEAIGELELSGSERFRNSLRQILGFKLVDTLAKDLEVCLRRKNQNLTKLANSKELDDIQEKINRYELVLPTQIEKATDLETQIEKIDKAIEQIEDKLRELPKSKHLQERRSRLGIQRAQKTSIRDTLKSEVVKHVGDSAPAILIYSKGADFENHLHIKENTGKLPAPYSDQLVEDILREGICICGRDVNQDSNEANKIRGLLKYASTAGFNNRVRSIQYLLKDVRSSFESYSSILEQKTKNIELINSEIYDIDQELKEIKHQIDQIDEETVRKLEDQRITLKNNYNNLRDQHAVLKSKISENQYQVKDLRLKFDNVSKRLGQGNAVKNEIDKINRLIGFLTKTLKTHENLALKILSIELNRVLDLYLTKHYKAHINPANYQVDMLDTSGRPVGRSTGEGQVLKFAFITTVVALAAKKTQEKINFLAEPTVAPLVLDAPFSALDPEYQSSVAKNLAQQTNQLVLLLSSAGWSSSVSTALEPHVGRRYMIVSKQKGERGSKPVKTMLVNGKQLAFNEYDSKRDESIIVEIK
jgi:DNA sulfur modification protein DndD